MPHTEPSGHKHDFNFFDLMGRNQTREEFCHFMNNLVRSIVNATSTALTEGESQVRRQFLRHGPPPVKIDKAEVMRHCAHYFSNTTAHAQTKNNNILGGHSVSSSDLLKYGLGGPFLLIGLAALFGLTFLFCEKRCSQQKTAMSKEPFFFQNNTADDQQEQAPFLQSAQHSIMETRV